MKVAKDNAGDQRYNKRKYTRGEQGHLKSQVSSWMGEGSSVKIKRKS